jgi:HemY protein
MMKRLLILLIASISLALAISVIVSHDPGYVRISYGHWLIESNLVILLLSIGLLIFSVTLLLGMKRRVLNSGKNLSGWFGKSSQSRALARTEKGLVALLEGNWGTASKLLSRSANKSHKPIINYLAAAHAANELGQTKDAELMLKKAYDKAPDSEFAVGIAQAQIQFQQEQYEPCLATLLRLHKQQVHHPFVLKLLKAVYLKLEDWHNLIKLLPALQRDAKLDGKKIQSLEALAWNNLFVQKTDELIKRSQRDDASNILASLWQSVPTPLQFDAELVETYAKQLIRLKQDRDCETLIRKVIERNWHDNLVRLYGMVEAQNLSEQLIHAEQWLKSRPNNPILLLTLGRLCLLNGLWGKAQEYFEASRRLRDDQETLAELCRLNIHLKPVQTEHKDAIEALVRSLDLPKLPQPDYK